MTLKQRFLENKPLFGNDFAVLSSFHAEKYWEITDFDLDWDFWCDLKAVSIQ